MADALDPSIRSLDFGIPAITGVVSHFCGEVLAKAKLIRIDTDLEQEGGRACHEVRQSLVVDGTSGDGIFQRQGFDHFTIADLVFLREQSETDISDRSKAWMSFVVWVYKMFNLRHGEFAHTKKATTGRYFVTEG